ncbi:Thiosulfate sulfurtransferase GlpE [Emticicia aquatica]|jgi:rhodanese-related sulfurtransferase|uniref:Thiosulfate sulfurtransferase GlpE n=1 Tax=Emticicia aquatica TaxID=1681835 RepID=A0ABM9ASB4_9BACT|nr:rhodanese-like domain-containing protein [Emticicia aquatica]CAH0996849.1 Thiosulfate sulfurtransferase GlpE [Emticicia aquatica]
MKTSLSLVFFLILLVSISTTAQTNLSVPDFIAKIKTTKEAQLLDVRTPQEWQAGKIASSNCINFNEANFKQQIEKLDKNKPVFVYCAAGGRSGKAAPILKEAGFKFVYNLSGGGYKDLANAGLQ